MNRKKSKSRIYRLLNGGRKKQTRLPTRLDVVTSKLETIKKLLMGLEIDRASSLRILRASFTMQKDYIGDKVKAPDQKHKAPAIRDTVCRLFGVSSATYQSIMDEFIHRNRVYTSMRSGNTGMSFAV